MLALVVHSIQIMDLWLFCQRLELDRHDHYSLLFDCIYFSAVSRRIRFCDVEVRHYLFLYANVRYTSAFVYVDPSIIYSIRALTLNF